MAVRELDFSEASVQQWWSEVKDNPWGDFLPEADAPMVQAKFRRGEEADSHHELLQ